MADGSQREQVHNQAEASGRVVLRYTQVEGILLCGDTRPNAAKIKATRGDPYQWRFSRRLPDDCAWYVPRTRDTVQSSARLEQALASLIKQGVPAVLDYTAPTSTRDELMDERRGKRQVKAQAKASSAVAVSLAQAERRAENLAEDFAEEKKRPTGVRAWNVSPHKWQSDMGIHQPWIAEISPMQYGLMSGRAKKQYDEKRRREWDASGAAKRKWAVLVRKAYNSGAITMQTKGLSQEAMAEIRDLQKLTVGNARAAAWKIWRDRNMVTPAQVVKGAHVYSQVGYAADGYGVIDRVWAKSIRMQRDTPFLGNETYKANRLSLQHLSDRDLKARFEEAAAKGLAAVKRPGFEAGRAVFERIAAAPQEFAKAPKTKAKTKAKPKKKAPRARRPRDPVDATRDVAPDGAPKGLEGLVSPGAIPDLVKAYAALSAADKARVLAFQKYRDTRDDLHSPEHAAHLWPTWESLVARETLINTAQHGADTKQRPVSREAHARHKRAMAFAPRAEILFPASKSDPVIYRVMDARGRQVSEERNAPPQGTGVFKAEYAAKLSKRLGDIAVVDPLGGSLIFDPNPPPMDMSPTGYTVQCGTPEFPEGHNCAAPRSLAAAQEIASSSARYWDMEARIYERRRGTKLGLVETFRGPDLHSMSLDALGVLAKERVAAIGRLQKRADASYDNENEFADRVVVQRAYLKRIEHAIGLKTKPKVPKKLSERDRISFKVNVYDVDGDFTGQKQLELRRGELARGYFTETRKWTDARPVAGVSHARNEVKLGGVWFETQLACPESFFKKHPTCSIRPSKPTTTLSAWDKAEEGNFTVYRLGRFKIQDTRRPVKARYQVFERAGNQWHEVGEKATQLDAVDLVDRISNQKGGSGAKPKPKATPTMAKQTGKSHDLTPAQLAVQQPRLDALIETAREQQQGLSIRLSGDSPGHQVRILRGGRDIGSVDLADWKSQPIGTMWDQRQAIQFLIDAAKRKGTSASEQSTIYALTGKLMNVGDPPYPLGSRVMIVAKHTTLPVEYEIVANQNYDDRNGNATMVVAPVVGGLHGTPILFPVALIKSIKLKSKTAAKAKPKAKPTMAKKTDAPSLASIRTAQELAIQQPRLDAIVEAMGQTRKGLAIVIAEDDDPGHQVRVELNSKDVGAIDLANWQSVASPTRHGSRSLLGGLVARAKRIMAAKPKAKRTAAKKAKFKLPKKFQNGAGAREKIAKNQKLWELVMDYNNGSVYIIDGIDGTTRVDLTPAQTALMIRRDRDRDGFGDLSWQGPGEGYQYYITQNHRYKIKAPSPADLVVLANLGRTPHSDAGKALSVKEIEAKIHIEQVISQTKYNRARSRDENRATDRDMEQMARRLRKAAPRLEEADVWLATQKLATAHGADHQANASDALNLVLIGAEPATKVVAKGSKPKLRLVPKPKAAKGITWTKKFGGEFNTGESAFGTYVIRRPNLKPSRYILTYKSKTGSADDREQHLLGYSQGFKTLKAAKYRAEESLAHASGGTTKVVAMGSKAKPATKKPAKAKRPSRTARHDAADRAGVAVCPEALYLSLEVPDEVIEDTRERHGEFLDEDLSKAEKRAKRSAVAVEFAKVLKLYLAARKHGDALIKKKPGTKTWQDTYDKFQKADQAWKGQIETWLDGWDYDETDQRDMTIDEAQVLVETCVLELAGGKSRARAEKAIQMAEMMKPTGPRKRLAPRPSPPKAKVPKGLSGAEIWEAAKAAIPVGRMINVFMDSPPAAHEHPSFHYQVGEGPKDYTLVVTTQARGRLRVQQQGPIATAEKEWNSPVLQTVPAARAWLEDVLRKSDKFLRTPPKDVTSRVAIALVRRITAGTPYKLGTTDTYEHGFDFAIQRRDDKIGSAEEVSFSTGGGGQFSSVEIYEEFRGKRTEGVGITTEDKLHGFIDRAMKQAKPFFGKRVLPSELPVSEIEPENLATTISRRGPFKLESVGEENVYLVNEIGRRYFIKYGNDGELATITALVQGNRMAAKPKSVQAAPSKLTLRQTQTLESLMDSAMDARERLGDGYMDHFSVEDFTKGEPGYMEVRALIERRLAILNSEHRNGLTARISLDGERYLAGLAVAQAKKAAPKKKQALARKAKAAKPRPVMSVPKPASQTYTSEEMPQRNISGFKAYKAMGRGEWENVHAWAHARAKGPGLTHIQAVEATKLASLLHGGMRVLISLPEIDRLAEYGKAQVAFFKKHGTGPGLDASGKKVQNVPFDRHGTENAALRSLKAIRKEFAKGSVKLAKARVDARKAIADNRTESPAIYSEITRWKIGKRTEAGRVRLRSKLHKLKAQRQKVRQAIDESGYHSASDLDTGKLVIKLIEADNESDKQLERLNEIQSSAQGKGPGKLPARRAPVVTQIDGETVTITEVVAPESLLATSVPAGFIGALGPVKLVEARDGHVYFVAKTGRSYVTPYATTAERRKLVSAIERTQKKPTAKKKAAKKKAPPRAAKPAAKKKAAKKATKKRTAKKKPVRRPVRFCRPVPCKPVKCKPTKKRSAKRKPAKKRKPISVAEQRRLINAIARGC